MIQLPRPFLLRKISIPNCFCRMTKFAIEFGELHSSSRAIRNRDVQIKPSRTNSGRLYPRASEKGGFFTFPVERMSGILS